MSFARVVGCGGLAVLWILLGFARADEVKVPLAEVPKAVLDSVKKKFPQGVLSEATKESEDGKTTYEIALKDGGRAVELSATADGTISEIETSIDAKALPAKVTSGLRSKYPNATIKVCEERIEIKDGKESKTFEIIVMTTAEKSVEVTISNEGKILKEEDHEE